MLISFSEKSAQMQSRQVEIRRKVVSSTNVLSTMQKGLVDSYMASMKLVGALECLHSDILEILDS